MAKQAAAKAAAASTAGSDDAGDAEVRPLPCWHPSMTSWIYVHPLPRFGKVAGGLRSFPFTF